MERLNIFVKYLSDYGGAERIALRFSNWLSDAGYPVRIVCGENRLDELPRFPVEELGLARPGRYRKAKSFYTRAGEASERLDGIHFSFEKMPGCHIYRPGGGSHRVFMEKSLKGLSGYQRIRKHIKRFMDPVNRLNPKLEHRTLHNDSLRRIIAISGVVRDEMIKSYNIGEDMFEIVHNGVNKDVFNVARSEALRNKAREHFGVENRRVIGFAASNFQLKGLSYLIEAVSQMSEEYVLLVAGGRRPGEFGDLAASLGMADRVKFLGKVSDMPSFHAALDVFCLPSFYDTFGNVTSEALCMGVPVCVSRFAGSHEIIDDECGAVIDEISSESVKEALETAYSKGRSDYSDRVLSDDDVFKSYVEIAGAL
ncbi:glycosyltransferase family 4 protein [Limisalsivibrio acetivorans]|uniref:glycosyltransferase family 4 protein n=1 Tax=Limisalsivibrio acetivorans TaxID=1304888 RepID=UPI0003B3A798|nr:glycosyltransferase family 4 protein [Limisalsivibrio acetivorans]